MNILITGASGNLGSELVRALRRDGHTLLCVTHSRPQLIANDGSVIAWSRDGVGGAQPSDVVRLAGDVRLPRFGLDGDTVDWLRRNVELVIHGSALTDFGCEEERYARINVDGTRHALALTASFANRPPFIHVSTAYVAGLWDGRFAECDFDGGQHFGNPYEWSKFEAEYLVREASAGGLQAIIVRPSVVIGDSATGQIRDFRHVYPLLRVLGEGKVRSVAGRYDARVDLVPLDYVVAALQRLVAAARDCIGMTFHAVSSDPLTLLDISHVLAEFPSMYVPRFLPPSSFDVARLGRLEQIYYERVVRLYESYFVRSVDFDSTYLRALMPPTRLPDRKDLLRRLIGYGQLQGYFGAAKPHQEMGAVHAQ